MITHKSLKNLAEGKCLQDKVQTILENMFFRGLGTSLRSLAHMAKTMKDSELRELLETIMSPFEKWRRHNSLTQNQAATLCKCTRVTIQNWEQGRVCPRDTVDAFTQPGLWTQHRNWFDKFSIKDVMN